MSTYNFKLIGIAQRIWSHISAAVAILLVIGALLVGYSIGKSSPTPQSESAHTDHASNEPAHPIEYTCSMHPTVRLSDPNAKCPICFMELIPIADTTTGEGMENMLTLSESAKAMSRIETAKVVRHFPTAQVRLFGKLAYDQTSVSRISAYFPGRIDRLFVNYIGVTVQEGDHLAEIYSPDLIAAFEELKQANKTVRSSQSASDFLRETARQTLAAARDKLRLFGLTSDQIENIESGTFDANQLTIYAPIGGVVTKLAVREGDYIKTGDPIATVANLSRLWLDLEAYESQLPMLNWGLPVTFTVEARPGELFQGQVSFIEPFIDPKTRTAAVRVAVDNTDGRLKPGMFATAIARPKITENGAIVSDELAGRWISPMHPTIVKDQPGSCDICGMDLVRAESLGVVGDPSAVEQPLVIPRTAVLFTGTRSVVYVQVPNADKPTYEGRTVELGPRAGEFYTVHSGLNEGEDIVVHGAFRIDSAMQILAKPSMMMPDGGRSNTGDQHGNMTAPMSQMKESLPISDSFTQELSPLYTAYLDAQEALADDNLEGFVKATTHLNHLLMSLNEAGLVGEPFANWRRAKSALQSDTVFDNIDDARIYFGDMSKSIMSLEQQFGHLADETWHVAFCPMAFNFEGAKWIQRGTEINNPYFGDQMLRCGDIQSTLSPVSNDQHEGHTHE